MTAGSVSTGAGTLTLGGNVTGNASATTRDDQWQSCLGERPALSRSSTALQPMTWLSTPSSLPRAHLVWSKLATGTLALSGANTYSGTTTINAGTLRIDGSNDRLPTGTAVTLANTAGAILDLNSFNQAIGSLAGGGASGGNITLGSGTLSVGDTTSTSYAGVISGAGNLIKNGTGTLTLSGNNSFTGFLSVREGTLKVATINNEGANGVLGAGDAYLGDTGTTGTLEFTGGNLSSDKRFFINMGATGVFQIDTLGTTLTLSGQIVGSSGGGNLTKTGAGTLVLSGANEYQVTTINSGVLSVSVLADGHLASGIGYSAPDAENLILNGGTLRYTGAGSSSDRLFSVGIRLEARSTLRAPVR